MAPRSVPARRCTVDDALREAGDAVWGLCRRLDDDPEDAFQVVFARLAEVIDRFDPDGPASLRTWVITVAHRMLVDRHRRRRARGEVVELGEVSVESDAEGALDRARGAARLEGALQRLTEDQRRVVLMHHLHGVELQEIARSEGVALGTVKSRLHRARARLLGLLGGGRMKLAEDLSRLASGDLPADEAAALRRRIAEEPEVARLWAELVALQHALEGLPETAPPAHLVAAVRGEAPVRRVGWWAAAMALAAAAAWAVLPWGADGGVTLRVIDGAHEVSGVVAVAAADVRVDVDGRVRVEVEPARSLARDRAAEVEMDRSHAAAALMGALVTVTVYEGTAVVRQADGQDVALGPGETRTVVGEPAPPVQPTSAATRVASLPPGADELTRLRAEVADLKEQLVEAAMAGAVARGQLAVEQGTPAPWPSDLPEALRPAAFEATVRAALSASGAAVDLQVVDCAEYPCLAVLRPRTLEGELADAAAPVVAALEGQVPAIDVGIIGTRFRDGDKDVGLLTLALGGEGHLENGGDLGRRTEWRAGTLARDLADEALQEEGGKP